ncbi:Zinc finger protein BRUTUS [Vitis vinifera]|uniref:Zinc finger protein BRUTUS n=1 Tax=Vitis vinifera TaxID=29760 RepID=A0A438JYJ7_VITVI|nr:Zinc finger protein BRUTUS [Vitis vinifera]
MATPLTGVAVFSSHVNSSSSSSSSKSCSNNSELKSPILIFSFFHKAIRVELDALHQSAMAFATGQRADIRPLFKRYHFLRSIYKHHCNAEDEVCFP